MLRQVAASSLPSLVLSLALSPREDLQQVGVAFGGRARLTWHGIAVVDRSEAPALVRGDMGLPEALAQGCSLGTYAGGGTAAASFKPTAYWALEFFTTLLAAVKVVHQDNGTVVAKELSSRLFQHVGVGKRLATKIMKTLHHRG